MKCLTVPPSVPAIRLVRAHEEQGAADLERVASQVYIFSYIESSRS